MIGLVFWSQLPSSQSNISQHSTSLVNSPATIHSFLAAEEGSNAVIDHHPLLAEADETNHKKYIPLNVVPESDKNLNEVPENKKKQIQISASVQSRQTVQPQHPVSKQIVVSPKLKKHLQQTEKNANELIGQSSDAFTRGLMSLVDYNLALNIAYDSKIETAEIRQTKQAKLTFLNEKRILIQQAVERLEQFDQPAAQGWYGDLAHARLILSHNQYDIASVIQDRDDQQFALKQISKKSDDYFSIRKAELEFGEAELPEYRRAASSDYRANEERHSFFSGGKKDTQSIVDYARELDQIKTEVEWLASHGAGLGRSDLLNLSKAQLTYVQGKYYQEKNQPNESRKLFSESMNHAKAAWSTRIDTYYPVGTSSLHDITTAWIMWKASETNYAALEPANAASFDQELKVGLDRMVNTADRISDQRGRMASDISLVRCLKNVEILTELKEQQIR